MFPKKFWVQYSISVLPKINHVCEIYQFSSVISFHLCSSTGNYHESLSDSKRATELKPAYLKVIVRGKNGQILFDRIPSGETQHGLDQVQHISRLAGDKLTKPASEFQAFIPVRFVD